MYLEIGRSQHFIHAMITDSRSYDPKTMISCLEFVESEFKAKNSAMQTDSFQVFFECKSVDDQEFFSCIWSSMKQSDLKSFFEEVEIAFNRSNSDANELGSIPEEFLGMFSFLRLIALILCDRSNHEYINGRSCNSSYFWNHNGSIRDFALSIRKAKRSF
jgi:hypothetical protein